MDQRDNNKPINGKVIFGNRSKSNGTSTDGFEKIESSQSYHAYYESADHIPPPGYVKLTIKEFKELFKDADIHYTKDQSNEQLSSSPSELNQQSTSSSKSSNDHHTVESDVDDSVDEFTTIISPSKQSNEHLSSTIESTSSLPSSK